MSNISEYLKALVNGGSTKNLPKPDSVNGAYLYELCKKNELRLIQKITLNEDVQAITVSKDIDGNTLHLKNRFNILVYEPNSHTKGVFGEETTIPGHSIDLFVHDNSNNNVLIVAPWITTNSACLSALFFDASINYPYYKATASNRINRNTLSSPLNPMRSMSVNGNGQGYANVTYMPGYDNIDELVVDEIKIIENGLNFVSGTVIEIWGC